MKKLGITFNPDGSLVNGQGGGPATPGEYR